MASLEDNFKKEFRQTLGVLPKVTSIYELSNPLEGKMEVTSGHMYKVRGIESDVFGVLNGHNVLDLGELRPERTVRDRAGKPKLDENENTVTEKPSTPSGSRFIRTKRKVDIPLRYEVDGFNFADSFEDATDGYPYIYAVPRENLYTVNLTALAVSSRALKCYYGHRFKTWHFGNLTVAVIPYNPNSKYTNTLIIGTKAGLDYDEEIKTYVNGLIAAGIVPNVPDFTVDGGYSNIVYEEAKVTYDGYEPESVIPVSEEGSLTYKTAASLAGSSDPEVEWEEPEDD